MVYRRYVIPTEPFTVAFRARHVGRHGNDAADGWLLPLVVGSRNQVRGYNVPSVLDVDCGNRRGRSPFEALAGSRLLVGNVGIRFPIFGLLSRRFEYGPLPIEGMVFADAGSLWTGGQPPERWQRNTQGRDSDETRIATRRGRPKAEGTAAATLR
ncbi:MAG: BamA/TamA family outer membrane protein [Vicinamibacterales bacterium]